MSPRPFPLGAFDNEADMSSTGSIGEDNEYSTSNGSGTGYGAPSESSNGNLRDKIIKSEEKAVRKTRMAVAAMLFVCAASVSAAVYLYASAGEVNHFKREFNIHADSIISMVQWEIQYNFALMEQASTTMTSSSLMTNATYPYFTHPTYEIAAGWADGMGGIMSVIYAPMVTAAERSTWETYSVAHQDWIQESDYLKVVQLTHQDAVHGTFQDHEHDRRLADAIPKITPNIFHWENGTKVNDPARDVYFPIWQTSPPDAAPINANLLTDPTTKALYDNMLALNKSVMTGYTQITDLWDWKFAPEEKIQEVNPHMYLMEPIYSKYEEHPTMVGVLVALVSWANILNRLLVNGENGIICVIEDTCGMAFSYVLNGQWATFLGIGDHHDTKWDGYEHNVQLELYQAVTDKFCLHRLKVYPTAAFRDGYITSQPLIFTAVVLLAFLLTASVFVLYDWRVTKRQEKTMDSAIRTNKMVASLFPENVRDRLMEDADEQLKAEKQGKLAGFTRKEIENSSNKMPVSRPIADFFPHVTVMFADIAGFTAWSSTREPFQVFQLLETIYGALDETAKRRRVFKVETVGDCYVAVAGMPDARKDHAVVMARFARDCIFKMNEYCRKLETTLGPDTADLAFRIGLHSGAVTAGVLRGQNARFQLFGDTMNTAARVESTGLRGRVQISTVTADLLAAAGKKHWFKPREERVHAKGKGEIETFWLLLSAESAGSSAGSASDANLCDANLNDLDRALGADASRLNAKDRRLIEWNMSVLSQRLKAIVAQREGTKAADVEIPAPIIALLESFVAGIASMYRHNDFHNFEHASHVTMSVTKMLSRIVGSETECGAKDENCYTKDITSDALTQLAVVWSALIHDADHQGVPNAQLVGENQALAQIYNNKSVAENNSIVISWDYLMLDEFAPLRQCICSTPDELERFKDLLQVCVLATDIADKELKDDRNARWAKVFDKSNETQVDQLNHLKAQIVLEHMIQASDICHTMQHWHIYRKWNERLFGEMYKAFLDGRAATNPAEYWYKGEIGFFDFYIIPLAQKLYECGVFGVSSDEFLNYARHNRQEWELKGQEVVAYYVEKFCKVEKLEQAPPLAPSSVSPSSPKPAHVRASLSGDEAARLIQTVSEPSSEQMFL